MIGKVEKFIRYTSVLAVGGRDWRICESRAWVFNSAVCISVCQEKKRSISAVPRPVEERMVVQPGSSFISSSMGRVRVAIISSAGMAPFWTMMMTRGKSV